MVQTLLTFSRDSYDGKHVAIEDFFKLFVDLWIPITHK